MQLRLIVESFMRTSLLDIGPTAEGDIIDAMTENLLDAGKWLKYAGQCVYDTVGPFLPFFLECELIPI